MTVHHATALLVAAVAALLLCPAALPAAAADASVMFRSSRRLTTSPSLGLFGLPQSWFRSGATAGAQHERSLVEQAAGAGGAGVGLPDASAGAVGAGGASGAGEAPANGGASGATDQGPTGGAGSAGVSANQGPPDTGAGGGATGASGAGGAGAGQGPANTGADGAGVGQGPSTGNAGGGGANQGPPDAGAGSGEGPANAGGGGTGAGASAGAGAGASAGAGAGASAGAGADAGAGAGAGAGAVAGAGADTGAGAGAGEGAGASAGAGAGGRGTPGDQAPVDAGGSGANQGPSDAAGQPDAAAAHGGGNDRAEPTAGVRMRDLVVWRAAKFQLKSREAQAHMAAGKTKAAEAQFRASALENATDGEAWSGLVHSCVDQMALVTESVEAAAGMLESGGEDVNLPRIHLSNAVTLALDCAEGFDLFAPGSSRDPRVKALQDAAMETRAAVMDALGQAADMAAMIAAGDDSTAAAAAVPSPSPTRRRLLQATVTGTAGAITVADPHNSIPETSSTGNPGIMPGGGSPTSANNTAGVPGVPFNTTGWMHPGGPSPPPPPAPRITPTVTVAQDGSGNFLTIQAAITAYPKGFKGRYVVFIQPGFYREKVLVNSTCKNVTLLGTGAANTVISWYDNATAGTGTFQTPTVAVDATGFVAIGIRFENTAGKAGNQAVAFRLTGDGGALYECEFIGWQDTLYTHGGRQYYRNCYVNGSVDFIFGNGAAVLDNCTIHIRPYTNAPVTASGRTNYTENTGIVLLNSVIQGDLVNKAYLGRPWKPYARVAIINTTITNVLNTSGWLDWNGVVYNTSTFIEQGNSGPGSVGPRIAWALPGIVTDPALVSMYYPNNFLTPFSSIANLIPFPWL